MKLDGWCKFTIEEIADVVGGGTPSTKEPENFGGDIPWLTPKDLSGPHDRYIGCGKRNLSQKGLENSSAKLLPTGSVLLSSRAPIGYVALAKNPIATNQGFRSLLVKEGFSPEYLYYWLIQNIEELKRHASGSTFRELSGSALRTIPLHLPRLLEQQAIAHILGLLDDKIELNRRTNETLEAMAQALFKSWFLDFDPVSAKMEGRWHRGESLPGLPADFWDIFPQRFVDSDMGKIPEGWESKELGELANIKGGKQLPKSEILDIGPTPVFGGAGIMGYTKHYNASGYVITVGRVGAYCGRFFAHRGKAWVNNNASLIIPNKNIPSEWLFLSLLKMNIQLIVKGAAQPFIPNGDLTRMKIIVPRKEVLSAFQSLTQSLILQREQRENESRVLAALRDSLIPRLLSGKLRVIMSQ